MSKKEFLRRKKPGSITRNEPKFIWLKMLIPLEKNPELKEIAEKYN